MSPGFNTVLLVIFCPAIVWYDDAAPWSVVIGQMVKDKITLCREMLPESAGVDKDPALSEVVGFLEACRPRMVDLVEAGVGGALGEDTFAKCLQVQYRMFDARMNMWGARTSVEDEGVQSSSFSSSGSPRALFYSTDAG